MSPLAARWPGAFDCHVHVFEEGYALAPTATFRPPHAPVSAYLEAQRAMGTQRVVIVQPTGYGFDNRCTLEALKACGPDSRAIVVVKPKTSRETLDQLHALGARGVRYMMLGGGVLPWESLEATANAIAPLGWNINLQLNGHDLPQHEERLAALPCRLVIDHIGKFLAAPVTTRSDGFLSLARLLDGGNCWIKLSAPYEASRSGPPAYEDMAALVRELAGRWPHRCLWASNWPHPNVVPRPDETQLLAWALEAMGSDAVRQQVLVSTPEQLYA